MIGDQSDGLFNQYPVFFCLVPARCTGGMRQRDDPGPGVDLFLTPDDFVQFLFYIALFVSIYGEPGSTTASRSVPRLEVRPSSENRSRYELEGEFLVQERSAQFLLAA